MCVHPIKCCQKDEEVDSERQDDDGMPRVCVARHEMKVWKRKRAGGSDKDSQIREEEEMDGWRRRRTDKPLHLDCRHRLQEWF